MKADELGESRLRAKQYNEAKTLPVKPVPTLPTYFSFPLSYASSISDPKYFRGTRWFSVAEDNELILLVHFYLQPLAAPRFDIR